MHIEPLARSLARLCELLDMRGVGSVMDSHTLIPLTKANACSHLLRFTSLHDRGRAIAVPCDKAGNVDIDSLTQRLRITYLGARTLIGREYSCPVVEAA